MFPTSFNIHFVFGYACFPCAYETAICFFMGQGLFFLVKTGWQSCEVFHALLGIGNKTI